MGFRGERFGFRVQEVRVQAPKWTPCAPRGSPAVLASSSQIPAPAAIIRSLDSASIPFTAPSTIFNEDPDSFGRHSRMVDPWDAHRRRLEAKRKLRGCAPPQTSSGSHFSPHPRPNPPPPQPSLPQRPSSQSPLHLMTHSQPKRRPQARPRGGRREEARRAQNKLRSVSNRGFYVTIFRQVSLSF